MISKQTYVFLLIICIIIGSDCKHIDEQYQRRSESLDFCQSFAENDYNIDYGFTGVNGSDISGFLIIQDKFWNIRANMTTISFVSQMAQQSAELRDYKMSVPVLNKQFNVFIDKNNEIDVKMFSDGILTDWSSFKANQSIDNNFFDPNKDYFPFNSSSVIGSGNTEQIDVIDFVEQNINDCMKTYERFIRSYKFLSMSTKTVPSDESLSETVPNSTESNIRYNINDRPFFIDINRQNNLKPSTKYKNSTPIDPPLSTLDLNLNKTINGLDESQKIIAIFGPRDKQTIESIGYLVLIETNKTIQYFLTSENSKVNLKTLIDCSGIDFKSQPEHSPNQASSSCVMVFVFVLIGAIVISCLYIFLLIVYKNLRTKLTDESNDDIQRINVKLEMNPMNNLFNINEKQNVFKVSVRAIK